MEDWQKVAIKTLIEAHHSGNTDGAMYIRAIKLYRIFTSSGLRYAKEQVDRMQHEDIVTIDPQIVLDYLSAYNTERQHEQHMRIAAAQKIVEKDYDEFGSPDVIE